MSSRRPSLQFIESRRCIGYRMDTYVMIFLVGASSQAGSSGNLAIDVCRAAPSPIVQSEQKKAAPNTDVVRANPFDCTRQSAVLLRPTKVPAAERDSKSPNTEKLNRPASAVQPALEVR
jgi:hypothetical protein